MNKKRKKKVCCVDVPCISKPNDKYCKRCGQWKLKKNNLKQYKIPCDWNCFGTLLIEAKSLKEAISKAKIEAVTCSLPEGYYIDGSFKLNIADKDLLKVLNR